MCGQLGAIPGPAPQSRVPTFCGFCLAFVCRLMPYADTIAVYTTNMAGAHLKDGGLRQFVAKRYGIQDVPDAVWECLDNKEVDLVRRARDGGDAELDDLLSVAKDYLKVYRAGLEDRGARASPPGRDSETSKSQDTPIEMREAEENRGRALAEFLTRQNDEDPTKNAQYARPIASKVTMSWAKGPPLWRITLSVSPWVSAKEVERAYRLIQQQVIRKDNRPLAPRSIAVFRFVEEALSHTEGKKPSWRKLLALYNARYPEGHELHFRDADPRNFQRTYERAFSEIVGCGFSYHFPPRKLTPDDKQQASEAWEKAEAIVALDEQRWKNRRKA
jgi:hypothetical protein